MAKAKEVQQEVSLAEEKGKTRIIKTIETHSPLNLLGNKATIHAARDIECQELAWGIEMFSKKTGRSVVVCYSDIKGYEVEYR